MLATCVKRFHADVKIRANEKEADGKRLLSLMSLGAVFGTELHFSIIGEDEEEAAAAIEEFCRQRLAGGKETAEHS